MSRPPGVRVVVAPDKFKGSLSADRVASIIGHALHTVAPDVTIVQKPIADGGEGTVQIALTHGFTPVTAHVQGPLGETVPATYAVDGRTAVIEMAAAAGLALLPAGPSPDTAAAATTYGVGQLLGHALDHGARRIVLGVGGSATSDGGSGLAQALGARILDNAGNVLPDAGGGLALASAATLDTSGLDDRLAGIELVVACDVDSPLVGPHGAAAVFGPQKGADAHLVDELDRALGCWADAVTAATGDDRRAEAGMGAAGGTAFAAVSILGGRVVSGIDAITELIGLDDDLRDADLLIVGEGSLDEQSLRGKGPVGLAARARGSVVAVVGRNMLTGIQARGAGLRQVYALTDLEPDLEVCINDAARLLDEATRTLASDWLRSSPPRVPAPQHEMSPAEWAEALLSAEWEDDDGDWASIIRDRHDRPAKELS